MNGTERNRELFTKQEMFRLAGSMNCKNSTRIAYYGNAMYGSTGLDTLF